MTADDLRQWLADAELSQKGLARLLDVNTRTVRRWCNDAQPIPEALRHRLDHTRRYEIDRARGRG